MNKPSNGTILVRRPGETLNRWNEMEQMQRRMDETFAGLFGYTPLARLMPQVGNPAGNSDLSFSPDLFETEDELVFIAPLPGIDAAGLNIEATEDTLNLKGERKPFYQNEKARQLRQGSWSAAHGEFQFTYALPILINPENVQAYYRNGVLELHLPKAEAVKPKSIKVNVSAE
jgi:HSP20 family protein